MIAATSDFTICDISLYKINNNNNEEWKRYLSSIQFSLHDDKRHTNSFMLVMLLSSESFTSLDSHITAVYSFYKHIQMYIIHIMYIQMYIIHIMCVNRTNQAYGKFILSSYFTNLGNNWQQFGSRVSNSNRLNRTEPNHETV